MDKRPRRKNIRLKDYDYSQLGYYFITICAKDRQKLFGEITCCSCSCRGGALPHPVLELTSIGEIVSKQWYELKNRYQNIALDQFVIMPNHIHGLIIIATEWAEQSPAPTIGNIICAYKSITTKLANKADNLSGRTIWQRNYYDHIIRNEGELTLVRKYIKDNPLKWEEDKYYL